jgi:hypothetical protein
LPESDTDCDAGNSNAHTNSYGYSYDSTREPDADSYSHGYNAPSLAHAQRDGNGDSNDYAETYADTEVAAYATSSSNSIRAVST